MWPLQRWKAPCKVVPETDYVLEQLSKKIVEVVGVEASSRLKLLNLSIFASFSDRILQEVGKEQVRQVLRASLAVATYGKKDPRVRKFFYTLFRAGQSSVALVDGVKFLQAILISALRGTFAALGNTIP